jgi:Icc-related predicted phosphoesterase
MRILVVADIHGKHGILQTIMENVAGDDFDIIISQGDFTDMFDRTPEFTQLELADIILQKLLIPKKRVLCVPGNHDPYEILDMFDEYKINTHHKVRNENGLSFIGWGGACTPFNTHFEPSEEETEEALSGLLKGIKGRWVLITHAPPKDTTLDVVESKKHVGSAAIRKIITERRPILALCAHIHENRGTERIGKTTVFYPGPAYEGYYGFVDIGDRVRCEIRKVPVKG